MQLGHVQLVPQAVGLPCHGRHVVIVVVHGFAIVGLVQGLAYVGILERAGGTVEHAHVGLQAVTQIIGIPQ